MVVQIEAKTVTRVCKQYTIITVNGQLPGPTLYVNDGDTVVVTVVNNAQYNATIHWYVSVTLLNIFENSTSVFVIDRFVDKDYKARA